MRSIPALLVFAALSSKACALEMAVSIDIAYRMDKFKIAMPVDALSYKYLCVKLTLLATTYHLKIHQSKQGLKGKTQWMRVNLPKKIAGLSVSVRITNCFGASYFLSYEFNAGATTSVTLEKLQHLTKTYLGAENFIEDGVPVSIAGGDYESVIVSGRVQLVEIAKDFPKEGCSKLIVHLAGTQFSERKLGTHYSGSLKSLARAAGYNKSNEQLAKGKTTMFEGTFRAELRLRPRTFMTKPAVHSADDKFMTVFGLANLPAPFAKYRVFDLDLLRAQPAGNKAALHQFADIIEDKGVADALRLCGGAPGGYSRKMLGTFLNGSRKKGWSGSSMPAYWSTVVFGKLFTPALLSALAGAQEQLAAEKSLDSSVLVA